MSCGFDNLPYVELNLDFDLILHKLETLVAFIPAQKVDFDFGLSDFDATYQLDVELPSDDFVFYHDLNKTSVDYGKQLIVEPHPFQEELDFYERYVLGNARLRGQYKIYFSSHFIFVIINNRK